MQLFQILRTLIEISVALGVISKISYMRYQAARGYKAIIGRREAKRTNLC